MKHLKVTFRYGMQYVSYTSIYRIRSFDVGIYIVSINCASCDFNDFLFNCSAWTYFYQ